MNNQHVFITGGTGYMGRQLIGALLMRGHAVSALARPGSEGRLPAGVQAIAGNALDAADVGSALPSTAETFIHLVGTSHPNPAKAQEFRDVDLASIRASTSAVKNSGVRHFIYVSVAHPAPVMQAYIDVRREGEVMVRSLDVAATIVRPWYVLGPGHRWPYVLVPVYKALEMLPWTREGARRLGLVSLQQMIATLTLAVENPPQGVKIADVPDIKRSRLDAF